MSLTKSDTEIRHLSYQFCEIDGHDTQPLSRICVDKQCEHKTLICAICELEKHKGHETIPLKNFLTKIYTPDKQKQKIKQQDKKELQSQIINPMYYASKIEQIRSSFLSTVRDFKNQICQTLDQLESRATIYFNHMSQKLLLFVQFQNPIQVMRKDGMTQSKLKKYFQQILDHVKMKEKFSITEKLTALLQKGQQKQKQLSTTLTKLKSETSDFIKKFEKTLDIESLTTLQKRIFTWSDSLKGTKMKINGPIAEQTGMESSGQRFIMLEPSLTESSDSKMCWGIKVIKFVGWIGVGVCLKNAIKKANFFFNYSTIGHGSYMISNNGYSWSHSTAQFNSAHKTFHFAQNDIVYMEYDRIAKKIRFRKNNVSGQKFELDVVDPPLGDSYHPCANICSTGDMVQVINPGITLS